MIRIEVEKAVADNFNFNFKKHINNFIKILPEEHVYGLEQITVTEFSSEKKVKEASGFYYGYRDPKHATIILCARGIFPENMPKILFYILPIIPKIILAETLFHEIGHHYLNLSHGYKKEQWEKSADRYSKDMTRKLFISSSVFRLIKPLKFIFIPIIKFLRKKSKEI